MKTNKFIAGLSALALAAALVPVNAFAADTQIKQDTTEQKGSTNVSYTVDPSYTVTIPASVDLGGTSPTGEIKAENVKLNKGQKITVTLDSATNTTSGSNFTAKAGEEADAPSMNYTIKKGTDDIGVGSVVAEFTENGSQKLTFAKTAEPDYAGTYSETLTFTLSVTGDTPAPAPLNTVTWNYSTVSQDSPIESDGIRLVSEDPSWKLAGNFYNRTKHTFTAPTGQVFKKIVMLSTATDMSTDKFSSGTVTVENGVFYSTQDHGIVNGYRITWEGNANEVSFENCYAYAVETIEFTLE